MGVLHATSADFAKTVFEADTPVFVDFWAAWCKPCVKLSPVLEELSDDFSGRALVVKVDVEEAVDLASRYGISAVPTLMVFRNGSPVESFVGVLAKSQMARMIDKHL